MITIGGKIYELVHEHKNGWNPEAFKERYSDVLERYDYIIGDWGYNQLRLKGFFRDNHPKATKETAIASLVDYIHEYCNFGCAYFVLQRTADARRPLDEREPDSAELPVIEAYAQAVPEATALETAAAEAAEAEGTGAVRLPTPAALRPGERIMRWREDQSTGRESRAAKLAAEKAEQEAGRPVRDGQERGGQKHARQRQSFSGPQGGGHAAKQGAQGGGQGQNAQHAGPQGGPPRGNRPPQGGRPEPRGGKAEVRGNGQGHGGAQGNGQAKADRQPRQAQGPRHEPREPRQERQREPRGNEPRGERPQNQPRPPKGERPQGSRRQQGGQHPRPPRTETPAAPQPGGSNDREQD